MLAESGTFFEGVLDGVNRCLTFLAFWNFFSAYTMQILSEAPVPGDYLRYSASALFVPSRNLSAVEQVLLLAGYVSWFL